MDVQDSDEFQPCAPLQGAASFDYLYSAGGKNTAGDKSGFKYSGPLASQDVFQASPAQLRSPLLAPERAPAARPESAG